MDKITKEAVEQFIPDESEKLEILTDLINGDYTVEALKQDVAARRETDQSLKNMKQYWFTSTIGLRQQPRPN